MISIHKFLALSIVAFVISCTILDDNQVIQVTMQNNGSEIGMTLSDTLQVSLKGNYTTAFRWKVSKFDAAILRLADTNYVPDKSDATGSPGTAIFDFTAVSKGHSELKLLYQDLSNSVSDSFSITVSVDSLPVNK